MLRYIATVFCLICTGAAADSVAPGQKLFGLHCAACHGTDATGSGPMVSALTVRPPDLTVLARGNSGVFPTGRVIAHVDGTHPLLGHGGDMPVFRYFFQGSDATITEPNGETFTTSRPIADVVAWLKTIQSE